MMQHQYWVTKKTVLKKLGTKEDDCIVASDAELDAKLELFRSISESCLQLQRVLDQYQERLCVLAQEENCLGKFLRDAGKGTEVSGRHMVSAGKAISYSGQQRLSVRGPLVRLYHEVETFRSRAVSDMRATVSAMEKARMEYRAALSWMKSTSAQLNPDTGRGLDNFRKAQRQVRESKKVFDKLTLVVLQKIDLLAAARCNMFSHVLSTYQGSFLAFASKVSQTLTATAETMNNTPQYEFSILKELSMKLNDGDKDKQNEVLPQDKDQMLFFQDEYKDETQNTAETKPDLTEKIENETPLSKVKEQDFTENLIDTLDSAAENIVNSDLAGLNFGCGNMPDFSQFMPSHLLQNTEKNILDGQELIQPSTSNMEKSQSLMNEIEKPKMKPKKDEKAAWFKLFAELDPLANPDNLLGSNTQSHAA